MLQLLQDQEFKNNEPKLTVYSVARCSFGETQAKEEKKKKERENDDLAHAYIQHKTTVLTNTGESLSLQMWQRNHAKTKHSHIPNATVLAL